jgi:hypothetical protein
VVILKDGARIRNLLPVHGIPLRADLGLIPSLATLFEPDYSSWMSTLAEIEAALPSLSREELARVEACAHQLQEGRGSESSDGKAEHRFDGLPWPKTPEETAALLAELDGLPPLLAGEEADRFEEWRIAEKERQKALSRKSEKEVGELFA